jgi:phage-related protein
VSAITTILPIATNLINTVFKVLGPLLPPIANVISQLAGVLGGLLASAVKAVLPPLVQLVESVFKALAPVLPPILALLSQLITSILVPILPPLEQLVTMLLKFLQQALTPLLPVVGQLVSVLARLLIGITPILPPLLQLVNLLVQLALKALTPLIPLLVNVVDWLTNLVSWASVVITWVAKIIAAFVNWLSNLNMIKTTMEQVQSFLTSTWNAIYGFFVTILTKIGDYLKSAWQSFTNDIKNAWNAVSSWFTSWWNTLYSFFTSTVAKIRSALSSAWNSIESDVKSVWNSISSWFSNWWSTLTSSFSHLVSTIKTNLLNAWNSIETDVKNVFNSIVKWVTNTLASSAKTAFKGVSDGISSVWSGLKNIFKDPVNFLISPVYDTGIRGLWNTVAGKIPGIPTLPKVAQLAKGGRVTAGTGPTADDVPALISRGETVVSAAHSQALAPIFGAIGVPGYATGGLPNPISAVKHAVSDVAKGVGDAVDVAKMLTALATGNSTAFKNALDGLVHTNTSGDLATMMTQIPKTMISDAVGGIASAISSFVSASTASSGGGAGGGGIGTAGVANSSAEAALKSAAAKMGWTGAQWQALYQVEMMEAGFNTSAQNPSSGAYGLAQFINGPSEYASYGGNSTTAAGQAVGMVNYVAQRYGNPEAALAHEEAYHWYRIGGHMRPGETGVVGEAGPELVTAGQTGATVTPMSGGGANVMMQFYGTQYPTPEQQQAMILNLTQAVNMS